MSESVTAAGTIALPTYDTIVEAEGVELYRHNDPHYGHWYVVDNYDIDHSGANRGRVRLTFQAFAAGITIGVNAEWSNDKPGELANYTPTLESGPNYFAVDDLVSVSDFGMFTAT